ncbi:hypothetical protein [Cellulomonas denverensis]|uniref:hypothetical protein n=1 Tax=Cellulomonas denverensis TaxID=264297 RepID=UPI0035ED6AAA
MIAVAVPACTADPEPTAAGGSTPAQQDTPDTPDTPDAPDTPAGGGNALLDGSTLVDIGTYEGTWLVTTVEGAVTTIDDPAGSELPSTWVIEPAGSTGMVQVRSSATTDDREQCLALPGDDVVSVATCDDTDPAQQFEVTALDRPEQVNISNANGYLVSDPEGGVAVEPDPASPASVFTLTERGAAAG